MSTLRLWHATSFRKEIRGEAQRLGLTDSWGREHERDVRLVQEHAVYAAMVEAMDLAVGKVLAKLDAHRVERKHTGHLHQRQWWLIYQRRLADLKSTSSRRQRLDVRRGNSGTLVDALAICCPTRTDYSDSRQQPRLLSNTTGRSQHETATGSTN